MRSPGVDAAVEYEVLLARNLDQSAVATAGAAARRNAAEEARRVVAPDDYLAAVPLVARICRDDHVASDVGSVRIRLGAFALEVAADEDGAAASIAGGVDARVVEQ